MNEKELIINRGIAAQKKVVLSVHPIDTNTINTGDMQIMFNNIIANIDLQSLSTSYENTQLVEGIFEFSKCVKELKELCDKDWLESVSSDGRLQ